jgi:hypothetical protein
VLIGGRSGVGKTTVAAEVHAQLVRRDVAHCVVEGDALDLAHPTPWQQGLDLAERNLAAVWRNYSAAGYRRLVLTGTAAVQADVADSLVRSMGDDPLVTGVLLTAEDGAALERLRRREVGSDLDAHVQRSAEAAQRLEALAPEWVTRLPTDGRTVPELAAQVIVLAGW